MKILNLLCLLLLSFALTAQNEKNPELKLRNKLDSLRSVLNNTEEDTNRVIALESLCEEYLHINSDSAQKYAGQVKNLAEKLDFIKGMANGYEFVADIYWSQNNYPMAMEYHLKQLKAEEELQDKKGITRCYYFIGEVYKAEGNYLKAIENYQRSLKIAEEINDKEGMANCYILIGAVHRKMNNYTRALEYYQKSLKIAEEQGIKSIISHCYNSIGVIYRVQANYPKALEYYNKSLKIKEQIDDKNGMAIGFNNIGNIHLCNKNYSKALECYQRSLTIMSEIDNREGIAMVYGNIAILNDSLKNYNEAIEFAEKSLKIATEIGSIEDEKFAQENLYKSYIGLKDYKNAFEHFKLYKSLNDSIFNIEKFNQITKIEAEYQNEKKQKEFELLKAVSAAESRRQKAIIYSVVSVLLLVLVFTFLTYRSYLQKQKANVLLAKQKEEIAEKNEELNQQNEEIAAQRDALGQLNEEVTTQRDNLFDQKRIALEQRDEIIRQKKSITDSIAYAKHIQTAMLPNDNEVLQAFPDNFVLFKPLDIVSGDFYWVNKLNGKSIIAVADCTGHGVPGAFMSVMGINFLNSIVVEQGVTDPGEILNRLNQQVIGTLSHADTHMQDKDGMDISLCSVDYSKMVMRYSCARNRIIVCREGELFQSDASKYSIGKSPLIEKIEFSTESISIKKGDLIYLMTDGYVDQFGSANRTKFLTSRFKKLILEIAHLDLEEQKDILDKTINDWQGKFPQVDDMLVVGFKV
jgi:serine phosphatase RsbU (regulator of sigma subunit)/tetratricopeptide (TPR) repeat protein